MARFSLGIACLILASCARVREYEPGPGPDPDIIASGGMLEPFAGAQIRCLGPADEIELLGSLCTDRAHADGLSTDAADLSFFFAADWDLESVSLPKLLLYGYFTEDLPPSVDHAADIEWAAVLVLESPAVGDRTYSEHIRVTLQSWPEGEALEGAIVTAEASGSNGCSARITASGTLLWRATTIEFWASVGRPC